MLVVTTETRPRDTGGFGVKRDIRSPGMIVNYFNRMDLKVDGVKM